MRGASFNDGGAPVPTAVRKRWASRWCGAAFAMLVAGAAWSATDTPVRVMIPERSGRLSPQYPLKGNWSAFFAGDSWVGVYCRDDGTCEARKVRIAARRVKAMDCDLKSKVGTAVSFAPLGPVFVTNLRAARPGKLESLFHNVSGEEIPSGTSEGRRIENASGRTIKLTIPKGVVHNDDCAVRHGVPLILSEGGRVAEWTRVSCQAKSFAGEFHLHWLGDIDGDGRTDMLMSFPDGTQSLMLSADPAARIETRFELIGKGGC